MKPTLSLLAVAAALSLGTSAAQAHGAGRMMLPSFDQLDQGGTGAITLQDLQTYLASTATTRQDQMVTKLMEQADAEGKLDADALRRGIDALRGEMRAMAGARGDDGRKGGRHRAEGDQAQMGAQMGARLFERMDANSDGSVDLAEYDAFVAQRGEQRGRGWGWRN